MKLLKNKTIQSGGLNLPFFFGGTMFTLINLIFALLSSMTLVVMFIDEYCHYNRIKDLSWYQEKKTAIVPEIRYIIYTVDEDKFNFERVV